MSDISLDGLTGDGLFDLKIGEKSEFGNFDYYLIYYLLITCYLYFKNTDLICCGDSSMTE